MQLVGTSPRFLELLESVRRVSRSGATVLLSGETGTGKDALARRIHGDSARRSGPFVALDCSSVPEDLLDAELFGYRPGAFTGAVGSHPGRLREAHRGTLYLDRVHSLSLRSQTRLLRTVEQREVLPLGATRPIRVDFRVVASAPPDLQARVRTGTFREDLYWRLRVVELRLPALRERKDDIQSLATAFLRNLRRLYAKPVRRIAPPGLELLREFSWPGNVRELRNVMEAALASTRGEVIEESDLPLWFRVAVDAEQRREPAAPEAPPRRTEPRQHLRRGPTFHEQVTSFQRTLVLDALARHFWDFRRAGEELGLERHQLKYLCAKLDVRRSRSGELRQR